MKIFKIVICAIMFVLVMIVGPLVVYTTGHAATIQLTGHYWETSDSLAPGKAILILPLNVTVDSVTVGTEAFTKLGSKYKNMEVWYGTKGSDSYKGMTITALRKVEDTYTYAIPGSTSSTGGSTGGTTTTTGKSETAKNPVYANNNRAHFRFKLPGSSYGNNVQVYFDNVLAITVPKGADRYEPGSGLLWKPQSENDGKLVVLGKYNVKYSTCTIKY